MNPERWKQIDELLDVALELEPDKRAAFLDDACAGNEILRKEVEKLLDSDKQEDSLMDSPALQAASEFLVQPPASRLTPGESIGPYKILSLLGAGGMGEVYRSNDTRIGREVAVKILPSHFSQDPDRLRRFEQEARAAGMLNHPNVVAIYDTGSKNGSPYLVTELLQGEGLDQKLRGHPLPVRKAIDYALQIAKGLSAAHEKGIIHRDLKPGNIFITKEGRVKVLDFGLAKLTHPEASLSPSAPLENTDLTDTGVVLGTIVYMSPEQVRGLKVDHRSDIFAFGAVLYEMLSGKRPFSGESQIEVMHAILKTDPSEFLQINPKVPAGLERIVRRCLEKDPDHRFQSTRDLAFALESLSSASDSSVAALRAEKPIQPAWIISAFFFLATLVLAVFLFRTSGKSAPQSNPDVRRLSIVLPEHSILNTMAISPDGRRLAYVVNPPIGLSKLWLRSLDSTKSEEVPGTEDASFPFWSPDSRSIGFFTQDRLKTLTIGAGPAESLYEVDIPKGGAWNQHGEILFAPKNGGGLYRIRAGGGEATLVTDPLPDETHRFPHFLPDGRHFFYIISSPEEPDSQGLYIGSLDSKEKKRLFTDATPVDYVEPGYGLFVSNEKLMIQPFDTNRLEFTGEATPITDNVESTWVVGPIFSVSANNVLVYGKTTRWNAQPVWMDRSGIQLSSLGNPGSYQFSDMSSDEKRLLTTYNTRQWMVDLLKGSFVRFAITDEQGYFSTAFSPDGSRVVYAEQGSDKLYQRLLNGTGDAELLFDPKVKTDWTRNISWSADGRFIIFTRSNPNTEIRSVGGASFRRS